MENRQEAFNKIGIEIIKKFYKKHLNFCKENRVGVAEFTSGIGLYSEAQYKAAIVEDDGIGIYIQTIDGLELKKKLNKYTNIEKGLLDIFSNYNDQIRFMEEL